MLRHMERAKKPRGGVHTPEYQYLLTRLRSARKARGLTQDQVADALSRHQSFVTKCELGERRLDPIDLARFAKLYAKPVSYFLPSI